MGITAAVVSAVTAIGSTAYSINQQRKQANSAPTLASLNPPNPALDQAKADAVAAQAGAVQKKKTAAKQGYASTILTSGQGTKNTVPPAGKTLLGL